MQPWMNGAILFLFLCLINIGNGTNYTIIHEENNKMYFCYPAENASAYIPPQEENVVLNEHDHCICKENYCECCEYDLKKFCVKVQYYTVLKIPTAFGLTVTYMDETVLNVVVKVTRLPCIAMPFIKDFMKLCLQLYKFVDHGDHVSVCIKMRGKFVFTKFQVPLGCVNFPMDKAIAAGKDLQFERYQYNESSYYFTKSGSRTIVNYNFSLVILGLLVSYKQHLFSY